MATGVQALSVVSQTTELAEFPSIKKTFAWLPRISSTLFHFHVGLHGNNCSLPFWKKNSRLTSHTGVSVLNC